MKKNIFLPLLIAAMTVTMNLQAQVRIGEDKAPEKGAILDLNSAAKGGLLLPNVNIAKLNEIPGTITDAGSITASQLTGLVIYSLTPCPGVYVWDGSKWEKTGEPCPCPELNEYYPLCNDANTIADLNKKAGSGITWYDVSLGGTPRTNPLPTDVTTTLYAELFGNCAGAERTRVEVKVGSCISAPASGYITTFVNVMYDFQHQKLEAYNSDGIATDFKWQVSTGTGSNVFVDIPGAPNSKYYTVPANFYADAVAGILSAQTETADKSLNFRCQISNTVNVTSPLTTDALNILFINTTTSGYSTLNGVKYLTLKKAGSTAIPAETMNIALLNLGQSGDSYTSGSSDATDLGDFYQWGRVADGHEHAFWSKNAGHDNIINNPAFGQPNATSAVIDYKDDGTIPSYNSSSHQVDAGKYYGKFIYSTGTGDANGDNDWYYDGGHDNGLWGSDATSVVGDHRTRFENPTWTYSVNNPCPSGWKVPSQYNWWDSFAGTGSNGLPNPPKAYTTATENTWQRRAASASTTGAIGGALITNADGERVFLPAAGYRSNSSGASGGTYGFYWSSTYGTTAGGSEADPLAFCFIFGNNVEFGSTSKTYGFSVRCVAKFE
ncbi:MAG: hypothetical protein LBT27_08865 [Prevotellaceae bacterium]|nr:hypothetical protein [Prevotellaceae bacterium]